MYIVNLKSINCPKWPFDLIVGEYCTFSSQKKFFIFNIVHVYIYTLFDKIFLNLQWRIYKFFPEYLKISLSFVFDVLRLRPILAGRQHVSLYQSFAHKCLWLAHIVFSTSLQISLIAFTPDQDLNRVKNSRDFRLFKEKYFLMVLHLK